jgi:hypothetical protein
VDVQPIINFFLSLGPHTQIKFITWFLCPSDIERIDLDSCGWISQPDKLLCRLLHRKKAIRLMNETQRHNKPSCQSSVVSGERPSSIHGKTRPLSMPFSGPDPAPPVSALSDSRYSRLWPSSACSTCQHPQPIVDDSTPIQISTMAPTCSYSWFLQCHVSTCVRGWSSYRWLLV